MVGRVERRKKGLERLFLIRGVGVCLLLPMFADFWPVWSLSLSFDLLPCLWSSLEFLMPGRMGCLMAFFCFDFFLRVVGLWLIWFDLDLGKVSEKRVQMNFRLYALLCWSLSVTQSTALSCYIRVYGFIHVCFLSMFVFPRSTEFLYVDVCLGRRDS